MKYLKSYYPHFIVLALVTTTLIRWGLSNPKTTDQLSNLFFIHSSILFLLGLIIFLASTSRLHYYMHLKARFSNDKIKESDYDDKEQTRKMHAKVGVNIAIAGCIGLAICGAILLL